jgi:predicted Zn-dependent protease
MEPDDCRPEVDRQRDRPGAALAEDIERLTPRIADPVVDAYLEQLARKLSAAAHARLPITVRVLRDDQDRVAVLPGGFIFLSSGLIRRASSEAELAGVIAHQIGHVAAGFGSGSPSTGDRLMPLILLGGAWGACTRFGDNALLPMAFKSGAAELERKADRLGSEYVYRAGYDLITLPRHFFRDTRMGFGRMID